MYFRKNLLPLKHIQNNYNFVILYINYEVMCLGVGVCVCVSVYVGACFLHYHNYLAKLSQNFSICTEIYTYAKVINVL